jgi:hypothetical protein
LDSAIRFPIFRRKLRGTADLRASPLARIGEG